MARAFPGLITAIISALSLDVISLSEATSKTETTTSCFWDFGTKHANPYSVGADSPGPAAAST